jgi:thiosulfate reductase cytochrome b subunit
MSGTKRLYLYSPYERVWHWGQALGILALLLTGVEIAVPGRIPLLGFEAAVWGHNALALILIANAVLGLFYYIATGTLRQLLPEPRDFITLSLMQARYYLVGIFRGEPHPLEKTAEARLNPLQRATYLVIMNVLLPLQVITGLAMWGCAYCPDGPLARIGGKAVLAEVHSLGSWVFAAFIVAHVYLTTTGHTPLASIKAMILGWEEVHPGEQGGAP